MSVTKKILLAKEWASMNVKGQGDATMNKVMGAIFVIIGVIIVFSLVKAPDVVESLFNWSSLSGTSPVLALIMPFIALVIVILLVFALVKQSRGARG